MNVNTTEEVEDDMTYIAEDLLTDLRSLINNLGADGGRIGPSVYDTAQVLCLAPPAEGVAPALRWLLAQQRADGGWGDPAIPLARDIPTFAAILALDTHGRTPAGREAIHAGLQFLQRQAGQWREPLPVDIPIGAEFVLPALAQRARSRYPALDNSVYEALEALGQRRLHRIATISLCPATTPLHSWEGWGVTLDPALLDKSGGLGHSPAATAAWLHMTRDQAGYAGARNAAERYLERAGAATGLGIPGVVPTVWPYEYNEQTVAIYALLLTGLLDYAPLRAIITPQLDHMRDALRPDGQGISGQFTCDGDNTAMVLAILGAAGYPVSTDILQPYIVPKGASAYCLTYKQEMQPSYSATAHAAYTLARAGHDAWPLLAYLLQQRGPDGRWLREKWHGSWLYLTAHALHALFAAGCVELALDTLPALLEAQAADGSWGTTVARCEETAYAIQALLAFQRAGLLPVAGRRALQRATGYLLRRYRMPRRDSGACWVGKELYRPTRISEVIERSALLACLVNGYGITQEERVYEVAV